MNFSFYQSVFKRPLLHLCENIGLFWKGLIFLPVKMFSTLTSPQPCHMVNSLPNDKFLDWFKLKAVADDVSNLAEKLKFVLGRVENIVGKGENVGYKHSLLFPQCV